MLPISALAFTPYFEEPSGAIFAVGIQIDDNETVRVGEAASRWETGTGANVETAGSSELASHGMILKFLCSEACGDGQEATFLGALMETWLVPPE